MNIKNFGSVLIIITGFIFAQEKTFYLKSGDQVTGTIMSQTDSTYVIETSFGEITIKKDDVIPEEAFIFLKSGDKLRGNIVFESEAGITIKTQFGEVFIEQERIERIDFKSMSDAQMTLTRPRQVEQGRWYYGDERLIDVFNDPTGYLLENNVLYLSGLYWGYGLSKKVEITSKWSGYFVENLNFRPKFLLFEKGDHKHGQTLSVGFHFHTRGKPIKYELKDRHKVTFDLFYDDRKEWVRVGSILDEDGYYDQDNTSDKMWLEVFGAYTVSNLKESGQGRINHTVGASLTSYPDYDLMPRVYYAINADARRKLKFIFKVFYDPYWVSILEFVDVNKKSDIDIDFGFIYAYNEQLRIGIHFQLPWIVFYYKF